MTPSADDVVPAGSGLGKFAWLARSVARNRTTLFPTTAAASAAGTGTGGNVSGDADVTSAPPTTDAINDDTPSQTVNVRTPAVAHYCLPNCTLVTRAVLTT